MFLKGELIHSRIHLWKTSFAINSTPSTLTMLMRSVLCRGLAKPLCCVQTWCWNLWIHFPILHSENTAKQNSQNTQEKKWSLKRLKHEHTRESPLTTASSHLLQSPKHIQIAPYGSEGRLLDSVSYRQNCT